ncbi:MAG: ABC transporter permease [Myxococcales bacterium]|nr:ABC transporter permease [Myxococcales bacterium]
MSAPTPPEEAGPAEAAAPADPMRSDEPGPARPSLLALPGRALRDLLELWGLLMRTIRFLLQGRAERGAVVEQMYAIGNRSVFFMSVTMGFLGAIIAFQSGLQAQRIVPDLSNLGATYIKFLVRDVAASVGAMPLATRVGAGIAAEIGSMVVTEQVDALRMCAADPVEYLVVPRFVASVVMGTAVLVFAGFVGYGAAMVVANEMFDVNYHTFSNLGMVTYGDVIIGVTKCVAYGAAIAIVSAHRGLRTFGGSEGVGRATTEAVVGSCFAIIVLNFLISTLGYFIFPG